MQRNKNKSIQTYHRQIEWQSNTHSHTQRGTEREKEEEKIDRQREGERERLKSDRENRMTRGFAPIPSILLLTFFVNFILSIREKVDPLIFSRFQIFNSRLVTFSNFFGASPFRQLAVISTTSSTY